MSDETGRLNHDIYGLEPRPMTPVEDEMGHRENDPAESDGLSQPPVNPRRSE
jgi:hypothetical protein